MFFASALYRISFTSVDLPEPETPLTTVINPSGQDTSIFCKLCSEAPRTTSAFPFGEPRLCGRGSHFCLINTDLLDCWSLEPKRPGFRQRPNARPQCRRQDPDQ